MEKSAKLSAMGWRSGIARYESEREESRRAWRSLSPWQKAKAVASNLVAMWPILLPLKLSV